MRADVKKALHVDGAPVTAWPGPPAGTSVLLCLFDLLLLLFLLCAIGWQYTSSYAACNGAAPAGTKSMIDFYKELAPALPGKVVVYNGDTDPCVSYEVTAAHTATA